MSSRKPIERGGPEPRLLRGPEILSPALLPSLCNLGSFPFFDNQGTFVSRLVSLINAKIVGTTSLITFYNNLTLRKTAFRNLPDVIRVPSSVPQQYSLFNALLPPLYNSGSFSFVSAKNHCLNAMFYVNLVSRGLSKAEQKRIQMMMETFLTKFLKLKTIKFKMSEGTSEFCLPSFTAFINHFETQFPE